MSSRTVGVGLAALCGIAIGTPIPYLVQNSYALITEPLAYTTLQPELEKQRAERRGEFYQEHPNNDRVISQAIMSDLKEAKQQVEGDSKGFAWGIREAIWGAFKGSRVEATTGTNDSTRQEVNNSQPENTAK